MVRFPRRIRTPRLLVLAALSMPLAMASADDPVFEDESWQATTAVQGTSNEMLSGMEPVEFSVIRADSSSQPSESIGSDRSRIELLSGKVPAGSSPVVLLPPTDATGYQSGMDWYHRESTSQLATRNAAGSAGTGQTLQVSRTWLDDWLDHGDTWDSSCSRFCVDRSRHLPDMMGGALRLGGQRVATFRPAAPIPGPATGPLVLDAANNRFVFFDTTNQLLVPGNAGLGGSFVSFQNPGGGALVQATNANGELGFFGVDRVTVDTGSGATVVDNNFDLITQPGIAAVTDPVSTVMFNSQQHLVLQSVQTRILNNPTTGAGGILRAAEGGSPIPRDRVFFNYSYFDNVPLGTGVDINRFVPGFEKTFFDGRTSIEARVPFASTLDSDVSNGGLTNSSDVQLGDVSLIFKGIFAQQQDWVLSGGLQLTLPTADDYSLSLSQGGTSAEFLRIENDTVHLMPFVGGAWMPTDRFFAQTMLQVDVDSNGRQILVNPGVFNGGTLTNSGRLHDATYLYWDTNIGYWLLREPDDSTRTLTGIAPMFETHYLASLSDAQVSGFPPTGSVSRSGDYEAMTVTAGCLFEFHQDTQLSIGYSTPVSGGNDRDFDGELRIMFSRRFGAGWHRR